MKNKKLAVTLLVAFVAYIGIVFMSMTSVKAQPPSDRYTKTSVDNTPLFIYTDTQTHCKFVYDSITRVIRVAKGYESCPIPKSFEE